MKLYWTIELVKDEMPNTDELNRIADTYHFLAAEFRPDVVRVIGMGPTTNGIVSDVRQSLIARGVPTEVTRRWPRPGQPDRFVLRPDTDCFPRE